MTIFFLSGNRASKSLDKSSSKRRKGVFPFFLVGQTALHQAAYNGQTEVVNVLLKAGANLNAKNERGRIKPFVFGYGRGGERVSIIS